MISSVFFLSLNGVLMYVAVFCLTGEVTMSKLFESQSAINDTLTNQNELEVIIRNTFCTCMHGPLTSLLTTQVPRLS